MGRSESNSTGRKTLVIRCQTKSFRILCVILLAELLCTGCDGFDGYSSDTYTYMNKLSIKDSLAIRAILDTNGLRNKKVEDVIDLQCDIVVMMTLDSVPLSKFIFTSVFDSLHNSFQISISNSPIESLVILDTIHIGLAIDVYNTKLKNIPEQISLLKGRLELYLPNNEVSSISPEIMKCTVYSFIIKSNSLCSVPDSLNEWIILKTHDANWQHTQTCN